eukprot:1161986-Pelagomonas_calceolata.AAC.11
MEPVRHFRVGGYSWGDMASMAKDVPENIRKYYNIKHNIAAEPLPKLRKEKGCASSSPWMLKLRKWLQPDSLAEPLAKPR